MHSTFDLNATSDPPPAYCAMQDEAKRLGWPEEYQNDLFKHDRRAVESTPNARFLWAIRPYGTHLVRISASRETRASTRACDALAAYVRHVSELWPESRWYFWDGKRLVKVGATRAADIASADGDAHGLA